MSSLSEKLWLLSYSESWQLINRTRVKLAILRACCLTYNETPWAQLFANKPPILKIFSM